MRIYLLTRIVICEWPHLGHLPALRSSAPLVLPNGMISLREYAAPGPIISKVFQSFSVEMKITAATKYSYFPVCGIEVRSLD